MTLKVTLIFLNLKFVSFTLKGILNMKKYFIMLWSFIAINGMAQNQITFTSTDVDDMLSNISTSGINGNILYNKCIQFADLTNFNTANKNTCTKSLFDQALNDLFFASGKQQFALAKSLNPILSISQNIVDIGILNTSFSTINYDALHPETSGLTLVNNKYQIVAGRQPFINFNKILVAALREQVLCSSGQVEFKLNQSLKFSNNSNNIKSLVADFGDGNNVILIDNGNIVQLSSTVSYNTSGAKVLKFIVTFNDNTSITTYSSLYVKLGIHAEGNDPLIEDGKLVSTIPFQGYDETSPIYGELDYRIFYHTSNGNTTPTLLKPIIISDGFDPEDKRKIQASDYINPADFQEHSSIEHFMDYNDCSGNTSNLIAVLRSKGYDVVVVNYPTYYRNGIKIDGGADYIERNAMNMVTLIQKLNNNLQTNGSTEQLAIAAPSMGGQITRYALAYMEKMFAQTGLNKWKHNTRLWISIDSPHLGANIPYGLQSLIYLATLYGSSSAEDFFYNQLKSTAAKQQLIEQFETQNTFYIDPSYRNGQTISQGFSTDGGSPFYKTFYDNQFNNGLLNSKGYPVNVRKIALINGSLSGQTFGTDNEKVIDLVGFVKILFWDHKAFQGIAHAMADYPNASGVLSDFMVDKVLNSFSATISGITNSNSRGNMDLIPGGWFPGYDQFVAKTRKENDDKISYWEERVNAQIHSFIPAFSALGMKQPEQDWTQPLDRNLVCSNETPFDSYYGEAGNTRHTSFNCESVKWMLKELDNQPQAPIYPFSVDLTGPSTVCNLNQAFTVSFGNATACKFPKPVINWQVSPNLAIVSTSPTSITVKATGNGEAHVSAFLGTGQSYSHPVFIGALPVTHTIVGQIVNPNPQVATHWSFVAQSVTGAVYSWYIDGNRTYNTLNDNTLDLLIPCRTVYGVECKISNTCGMSGLSNAIVTSSGACPRKRPSRYNPGFATLQYDQLVVNIANADNWIAQLFFDEEAIANDRLQKISIYNKRGELMKEVHDLDSRTATVDVSELPQGTYLIEIIGRNDYKELHTFHRSLLKQEQYLTEDIATGNIPMNVEYAHERLYVLQQKLFIELQSQPELLDASGILKDFVSNNATKSFGTIYQVEQAFGENNLNNIQRLLNDWQLANRVDENFFKYYSILLKVKERGSEALNEEDIAALKSIAQRCPLVDGEIVYAARSMYHALVDGDEDFANACGYIAAKGTITNTAVNDGISIYPNPGKGVITIKLPASQTGYKHISVTNVYGKIIAERNTLDRVFMMEIKAPAGIYFLNIYNQKTSKTDIQKLVIE